MHPVAAKLSSFIDLTAEEISALSAVMANTITVPPKGSVALQGDRPESLYFLLDGMMLRQKALIDGGRQVLSILLPGDPCDIGVTLLDQRDHALTAVNQCKVARVSDASIELLSSNYPKIRAAFRWVTLAEEAIAREWLVNVGQRDAVSRMAHLFCELYYRNLAIGQADGLSISLPLTQQDLGDVLGISSVHTNRVLQQLRGDHLVSVADGRLTILSLEGLEEQANFDPTYLHLQARFEKVRGSALVRGGRGVDGKIAAALRLADGPDTAASEGAALLRGHTVLVLEDDFYAATDTVSALRAAGAAVMGPFANEADAFDRLLHGLPSFALLDIGLGGEPTFELARVLRDAGVPFMFVTGYERTVLPADLAMAPHILKPVPTGTLVENIQGLR